MSRKKGDRTERELVSELYDRRGIPIRVPSSGSRIDRELPDLICGLDRVVYALEAKSSSGDPIYIDPEKIEQLTAVADAFGGMALVAVRWDEERGDPSYGEDWPGWYFHAPAGLEQTDGGNYRIRKEKSVRTGLRLTSFPPE